MDTTLWIILAAAVVIALVIYGYRHEIVLKFKGWGFDAFLSGKGAETPASKDPPERGVRVGQDAKNARIVTGDAAPGAKAGTPGARSVSIGRDADGSTIVTGDGNKAR
jgi:hypothetical protein